MSKYNYLILKQIKEIVFMFGTEEDLSKYDNIYWSDIKFNNDNSNVIIHIAYSYENTRASFEAEIVDNVQARIQQKDINNYGVNLMVSNNLKKYRLQEDNYIELKG